MINNYHTLAFLIRLLRSEITGRKVEAVFTQDRDQLVLEAGGPTTYLVISCRPALNTLYLNPRFARAKRNTLDILGEARGRVIRDVSLHPHDRIVSIHLDGGMTIKAMFFGQRSNVLLLNDAGIPVDSFKKPGKPEPPGLKAHASVAIEEATTALQSSEGKAADVLKKLYPTWGALLIKETLHRASIPASAGCIELSKRQIETICGSLAQIARDLENPRPRLFSDKTSPGFPVEFSLIPLHQLSHLEERMVDDVHEAIRIFVSRSEAAGAFGGQRNVFVKKLETLLSKIERSAQAVERDLAASERVLEYERFGRMVMSSLDQLKKGLDRLEISDGDGIVRIPLSPGLTPVQNAQKYFDKAKKSRATQEQAKERLGDLRTRASALKPLLSELESVHSQEELDGFLQKNVRALEAFGLGKKRLESERLPFRVFLVDGEFEVWAGKSSKDNDQLTLKHSKPEDLWFHVRGAGGSHVVLKVNTGKGEPGKKARVQAAGIAAYFSKQKNARLVPVAMTRRKYVRKPKGAPAGTVMVEREEVIFAEPKLPDQQVFRSRP